jgi:DNA-binding CsgD family transcriptional regulator
MALIITADHPTFALTNKIQVLTDNFLKNFGFNYFQYLRCFADGSVSLLTNATGLFENFNAMDNSPVIFSSFNENNQHTHSYWFLWDEELPHLPVTIAREKFSIHHGLTLVRRSKNYYDMIAVGLPNPQRNAGSFYLNKLKGIEQFIQHFDTHHQDLLTVMNNNPIALSEPKRDVNYKNICLSTGRVNVQGKEGQSYITSQELACIRLLVQGASHKEIAKALGVSNRTVETYLARIKQRTGLSQRSDIEWMLSSCQ